MSRLSLDTSLGWLPRDSSTSVSSLLDAMQPGAASFDQHLQQAQQTADWVPASGPPEASSQSTHSDSRQSHTEEKSSEPASRQPAAHADESSRRSASETDSQDAQAGWQSPGDRPPESAAEPDQNTVPRQAESKPNNTPSSEASGESVEQSHDDAAKKRAKQAEKSKSTAAASAHDAKGKPGADPAKAESATTNPADAAALAAAQAAQQADAIAPTPTNGEQAAGEADDVSQVDGQAGGKRGVAAAKLRKAAQHAKTTGATPGEPAETGGPPEAAVTGANDAANSPAPSADRTAAERLQDRLADSQASSGAARRMASRPSARSANDEPTTGSQTPAAGAKDGQQLADATLAALAAVSDVAPPALQSVTPPQAGQPHHADGAMATEVSGARSGSAASSGAGSAADADGPSVDTADRVRFTQRIARAMEAAADRGGSIRLRLHPPELGALKLEITVRNGTMNARIETETEAAKNLLADNLPALKERLAEHQIKVERFDVDWQASSQGGNSQGSGEQSRWQAPPSGMYRGPGLASRQEAAADAPARAPARTSARTNFDVVI